MAAVSFTKSSDATFAPPKNFTRASDAAFQPSFSIASDATFVLPVATSFSLGSDATFAFPPPITLDLSSNATFYLPPPPDTPDPFGDGGQGVGTGESTPVINLPRNRCAVAIKCEGVDNPVSNTSSEAPDILSFTGVGWTPFDPYAPPALGTGNLFIARDCDQVVHQYATQAQADIMARLYAIICQNPGAIYLNTEQSVLVYCANGTTQTRTIGANLFPGLTQASADAFALAWLEQSVTFDPQCPSAPGSFWNTEQSAMFACPDGSILTYTFPAGLFVASSQEAADQFALDYIQQIAASTDTCPTGQFFNVEETATGVCPDGHLLTYTVQAGLFTGNTQAEADEFAMAFANQMVASNLICPNPQSLFYNTEQTYTGTCPNETKFTVTIAANTFAGTTQAEADDYALRYAEVKASLSNICNAVTVPLPARNRWTVYCPDGAPFTFYGYRNEANARKICLSPLEPLGCSPGSSIQLAVTASGNFVDQGFMSGGRNLWQLISGAVPAGMELTVDPAISLPPPIHGGPSLYLIGTPTGVGFYQFLVRITNSNGDWMQKDFQVEVLPEVKVNRTISQFLASPVGMTSANGTLVGSLPTGTNLVSDISGNLKLTGAPTAIGICSFTIIYRGSITVSKTFIVRTILEHIHLNPQPFCHF